MWTSYDVTNDRWRCCGHLYRPTSNAKKSVVAGHITGPPGDAPIITYEGLPMCMYQSFGLWGNATARSRLDALKTAIQTAGDIAASGKLHLWGTSAGGLDMLNWAKYNPTLVQSISVTIPVINPQDVWDNDNGGFKADVNTAYGCRPTNADCPWQNQSAYIGIPMQIYYSENDPVNPVNWTTDFIAGTGATGISMGNVGHSVGPPRTAKDSAGFMLRND